MPTTRSKAAKDETQVKNPTVRSKKSQGAEKTEASDTMRSFCEYDDESNDKMVRPTRKSLRILKEKSTTMKKQLFEDDDDGSGGSKTTTAVQQQLFEDDGSCGSMTTQRSPVGAMPKVPGLKKKKRVKFVIPARTPRKFHKSGHSKVKLSKLKTKLSIIEEPEVDESTNDDENKSTQQQQLPTTSSSVIKTRATNRLQGNEMMIYREPEIDSSINFQVEKDVHLVSKMTKKRKPEANQVQKYQIPTNIEFGQGPTDTKRITLDSESTLNHTIVSKKSTKKKHIIVRIPGTSKASTGHVEPTTSKDLEITNSMEKLNLAKPKKQTRTTRGSEKENDMLSTSVIVLPDETEKVSPTQRFSSLRIKNKKSRPELSRIPVLVDLSPGKDLVKSLQQVQLGQISQDKGTRAKGQKKNTRGKK